MRFLIFHCGEAHNGEFHRFPFDTALGDFDNIASYIVYKYLYNVLCS